MNLEKLSGSQKRILLDAILAGFDRKDLDTLLWNELDFSLEKVASPNASFNAIVPPLIDSLEERGQIFNFLEAVQKAKPHNPNISNLLGELRLLDFEGNEPTSVIQRSISETGGFIDPKAWSDKIIQIETKVCRIQDNRGFGGTGFLVGPDLVMTSFSVVEQAVKNQNLRLSCRFDYMRETFGENPGNEFEVSSKNWLVASSSYSQDLNFPGPEELDFALIRLSDPIGERGLPNFKGFRRRLWITRSSVAQGDARQGERIFLLSHPMGGPAKISTGQVVGYDGNRSRVRYDAATEPGSAGAPCFNSRFELIALHQIGQPNYNAGVRVSLIIDFLTARYGDGLWT